MSDRRLPLIAWRIRREEDYEETVVVATDMVVAVEAWRLHVKEHYGLTREEAAEERPINVELLCNPGEVVIATEVTS